MAPPSKRQANHPSSTSSPNAVLPLPGLAIGVIAGIAAAIASHNLLRKKEKKKKKKGVEDVPSPSLLLEETQIITCKKDEDEEEEEEEEKEEEKEDGFSEKPLLSSVNELDFRLAYGEDLHLSTQDSSISSSDIALISSNEGRLHEVSNDILKPFPSEFYDIKSDNLSLNEREREREREYLNWAETDKKHVSHMDLHPLLTTQSIELRRISTSNIETEIDLKHDNVGNTSCFWIKDSNPQLLIDGSKILHMDMNNQHSSLELLIDGSETGHMNVSDEENIHARRIYDDICLNHKYDQPKSQLRAEESNDTGSITSIPSFNDTCLRKHVETNQQFFTGSFDNGIQQSNFQPTLERSDNGSEKLDLQSTMEGYSNGSKKINVEPGLDNGSNTQPAMQGSDDVSENHNLQPAMEGFVNHIEKPNLHLTIEKLDDDSKYHNLQSIKEKSDEDSEKPNLQSVKGKSDNDSENPTLQPTTEELANSIEQLTMEKLDNGSENPNLQPTIERFDNGTEKSDLQPTMDNGIEKFNLQPASEEQSDNGIENPKLQAVMERSDNGSQNPDPQPPLDGSDNDIEQLNIQPRMEESDNDIEKPKLQPILKRSDYRSEKPSLERTMDNGIGEPNLQPTIAELDNGSENLNLKPEMEESDNGTENLNLTSSWEDVNDPCLLCAELYPILQSAVDPPCLDRGFSIQSITNGFDEAHSSIDREPNLQSMALGSDEPWSIDTHDTYLRCVNGCSSTLRMPYETFANEQPNIRSIEAKLDDNSLGVDGQDVKLQSIVEFNDANLTDNGEHDQPLIMEGSEYTLSDTIVKLDAGSTIKGNEDTLLLFDKEISVKSTMAKCLENISQEQELKLNLQFEVEEYVGKVHAETTKKVTADPCLCADHHHNFQLAIEIFDDACNLEANPPSGDDPNLQLAMESFHVTCTNVEANLPLPVDGANGTCISINENNALLLATKNSGNTGSCVNDDISISFGRDSYLQTTLEGSDDTSSISTSEQLPGIKVYENIVSTDEREQKMDSLIEGSGFGRDSNLLTTLEGSDDTSSISTSEQLPGIKVYEKIVSTDEREQKMDSLIEGSGFGRDSNLLTTLEGSDDTSSISTSEQLPGIKVYEKIVSTDEREQKMESLIEGSGFGRDSNLLTTLEGSDDTSSISTSEQLPGIKVYEKIVSTDEREQKMESLIEGSGFGRDSNLLTTLEGSDDTSSISTSEQLPGIQVYENIVSTDEREQKMESVIEGSDDADLSAELVDNVEHSNQSREVLDNIEHSNQSREVSEKCCSFPDEAHDDLQSIKECSEDTVLSKDIEPNLKSNFAGNNFIQTNEHVNLESIMEQSGSIFPNSLPHLQPIVKESEKICSSINVEHDFRETMEGWNKQNGEPDIQLIGEHIDYTCLSKCEEPDDQSTMEGVSNLPICLGIDGESIFLSVLMESDSAGEPKSGSGETCLTSDTEPNAQLKMEESDDGDDHLTSIGVPNIHPMMKGSDPTFANQNVDGEIYFESIVEHGNNNYLTSNGYYNCQLMEGLDTCAERAVEKYDGTNSDIHGNLSLLPMGGETCFGTNFVSMVVQEESDSLSIDGMPNNQSILEGYDYMCLSGDGDHILQPKIEVSDDINECCLSGDDECNHKITREGSIKSCLSSDGNPDLHLIENFSDYRTMGWSCNISENSQLETCLSVDRETPLQSTMIPGDNTCLSYNEYPYIQSKREEYGHTCAGRVHNLPSTLDDSLDIDGESSVERSDNANLQLIASFDEICQTSDRELNVQSEMDESADATPVRSEISNVHSFMKDSATIFSIIGEETHSKLIVEVGNDTWLTSSGYDKLPKLVKHLDVCSSNETNVHTILEECDKTCFCINNKSNLLSNVAIEESDMAYFTPIDGVSKCQSLLETNDDCLTANGDCTIQPIVEFSDDVDNMYLSDGVVTDDNVPLISNHGQLIINDADPNPQSAMETRGPPYTHTTINDKYDDLLIMDRSNDTCSVSDELQCSREGFEISCLRADGEQDLRSATESVSNTSVSIVDEKLHLQSRIKNTDQHHMLKSTIEVDESDEMCLRIEREPDFQYKFNTRSNQSRLMSTDEIAPNDEDASNGKDEILGHTIIAPLKEHNVVKDTIIDPVKEHGDCPLMDHSEEYIVKSRGIDINDVKEPVCNDVIEKRKFGLNGTEKKPSHANSSGVLSREQGLSSVKKEDGELRSSDGNGDMKIKEAPPSIHTSKKSKRRKKVKKDKVVVRGTDYRQEVLIVHQSKDGWFPNKFEKLAPHFVLCFVAACLFIVVVSIVQQFLQLSQPLG